MAAGAPGVTDPGISPNHAWRHLFKILARRGVIEPDRLGAAVPELRLDDIAAAATLAKATGSQLNSLSHRLLTQAEHERRRSGSRPR